MISNHAHLTEKMENRFTLLDSRITTLHEKYEKQETSFRSLSHNMAKQTDLDRVEGTINNIASQADAKFFSVEQELESLRNAVSGLQMDNIRLQRRNHLLEEKQNFNDIKAKRFSLTNEGLADVTDTSPKNQGSKN